MTTAPQPHESDPRRRPQQQTQERQRLEFVVQEKTLQGTALAQQAIIRGVKCLLDLQAKPGYWCAELEGDSILQSEYILLKYIVCQESDHRLPLIANYLRTQQQEDGSWNQYPGAKPDISATVKAYFALKLLGDNPDAPHMAKARKLILQLGGAEKCNSFSKFYLGALGQVDYDSLPSIPPEIIYLPHWFPFCIDNMAAWTRTMITTLSIVTTHRYKRPTPLPVNIDELFKDPSSRTKVQRNEHANYHWSTLFLTIDAGLKVYDKLGKHPLRKHAIDKTIQWIIDHTSQSEGIGAIFPPMVYIQIALRAVGYPADHPLILHAEKVLDDLMIYDWDKNQIRIQPCFSPMWDTGIAAYALTEAGLDQSHPAMKKCAEWLVSKECKVVGDWVLNARYPVEASGWYFEFLNEFYPDSDDTAMVAMSLKKIGGDAAVAAARRGAEFIFTMQNNDGGWAAFDRTEDRPILEYVPFADHNAMQDPSCPDITGRVIEGLGHIGYRADNSAVANGIDYIKTKQYPDGSFFGRWGVNYIYGTWQVLAGLSSVHYDMSADWTQRAGQWLRSVQKEDGSFGETADSYEDPSLKGQGPSTASQTAWGTMGLMSVYGPDDPGVQKGIQWLSKTQLPNGNWHEPYFTGTGFPKVFYLRYHYYKTYFPVMAIGRYLKLKGLTPAELKDVR
jgi:squalene-hopene/tetraprenyl-beta-curcumene cyclase